MEQELRERLAALEAQIGQLTARVYALEQKHSPATPAPTPPPAPAPAPQPARRPLHRPPPDLESRIGSQWLNRIGVIAVLFGVAYFLKYAFENHWIEPAARVIIGLIAGCGLFAWSEMFRRRGALPFSHTLRALSLGVLYLSLWAGFQLYSLIPAALAFTAMCVVTGATLYLSVTQNAQFIAAMALVGGLLTPALVSQGGNHETFLFSYLAVLSFTAAVLARRRSWFSLPLAALLGTTAYYVEWYGTYFRPLFFTETCLFVGLFFAIFLACADFPASSVANRMPEALLLLNAAFSFTELYVLFGWPAYRDARPWVLLLQAVIYIGVSQRVGRRPLRQLNIAVAVGLVTVAIGLEFHTYFITLGWLVEAAALLAVAARNRERLLALCGSFALAFALIRLIAIDVFRSETPFWNARVLLFAVAIAITAALAHYARRSGDPRLQPLWYLSALVVTALTLLGLDGEISLALRPGPGASADAHHAADVALNFARSALWMAYGAGAMALGFLRRIAFYRYLALGLLGVTVCKVFLYDIEQLNPGYRVISFITLGVILLAVSYAYQRDWLKLSTGSGPAA